MTIDNQANVEHSNVCKHSNWSSKVSPCWKIWIVCWSSIQSPPSFFYDLFLSNELVDVFVDWTNKYADGFINQHKTHGQSHFKAWKLANTKVMKLFTGMIFHLDIGNLPRISDHWSNNLLYETFLWRKLMPKNRFLIMPYIWHFDDVSATESRLQKVSVLIKHLNDTMWGIYSSEKDLA